MKKEIIQSVVEQIINMYDNNVLGDNGNEYFECWCENGGVFENKPNEKGCIELMERISPFVDALTNEIENCYASIKPEHRIIDTKFGEVMLKSEEPEIVDMYIGDNYDQYIGSVQGDTNDDNIIKIVERLLENK